MPAEYENLVLYFGPRSFGAPDDVGEPILRGLWGARKSLARANVDVRVDTRSRLMHNNFVVVDSDAQDAAVITTSANFTPTGLHHNLEHLLVFRERHVIEAFQDNAPKTRIQRCGQRPRTG
jgi:phosphatidylserine/phosphatidylglycerophosphate/cardiolipin synthase-like enzyme